jgi:hypothetical protein
LSAEFTKAFLTVAEYPPDAHRGFDVPAAQLTFGVTSLQDAGGWDRQSAVGSGSSSSSSGSWAWNVVAAEGAVDWHRQQLQQELPLMQALAAEQPQQVSCWHSSAAVSL